MLLANSVGAQSVLNTAQTNSLANALIGTPFVQAFGPEQHGAVPEVWAIAQAANGDVLASADDGLIVRSGGRFALIAMPEMAEVTAMAACGARVAVGGYERFGHFELSATGSWAYQAGAVPAGVRLSRVPDVSCRQGSSYFAGLHWLLIQESKPALMPAPSNVTPIAEPAIKAIHSKAELSGLFNTSQGMLVGGFAGGLFQIVADRLKPLPGAELLPAETVMGLIEQERALLVFLRHSGLWKLQDGQVEKLALPYQKELSQSMPYVVRAMADGSIAIGTSTGELWWLREDLSLRLRFIIDSDDILALTADSEQGLWVTSRRAMYRVSWPSAWTLFDARFGLRGSPAKVAFYKGRAFVATSLGVFEQMQAQRFEMIGIANEQSLDLAVTADGLLSAYTRGAYSVDRKEFIPATRALDVFRFYVDPARLDRLFIIHYDGVAVFELRQNAWLQVAELGEATRQVGTILKIATDEYLLDNADGFALRVRLNPDGTLADIDNTQGAPPGASQLLEFPEGPVIAQDSRLYLWQSDQWRRNQALEQLLGENDISVSYVGKTGHHWVAGPRFFAMREQKSAAFVAFAMPSPGMRNDCLVPSANGIFLCTTRGLARFSSMGLGVQQAQFKTQIVRAAINGVPAPLKGPLRLNIDSRIQFQFSVDSVLAPVRYRSRLVRKSVPNPESWSDFSDQASVSLQALPPDTYLIEAQAQTADLRFAGVTALQFEVRGNFWSNASGRALRWALALASAALLMAILLVLRNVVLARTARTLQAEVARRTLALAEQTRVLQHANLQLAALANLDGLTGIANRREFDNRLLAWLTPPSVRSTLILALLDLDHFKGINDSYGHLAGDDLLVRFANFVSKISCAEADAVLFARTGGEEFALLLKIASGQTLDFVHPWLESIRADVQHAFADIGLTISLGYQQLKLPIDLGAEADVSVKNDREALIEAADRALYRAKRAGRNRIYAASLD